MKDEEEEVRAGAFLSGLLLPFIYKGSTLERCSIFSHMFLHAFTLT